MTKTYPVPCTKEEINKLIDASMEDEFYYTLFTLAKFTGRRLGEYYDIKVKDINFETNTMITKILKRKKPVEKEAILNPECSRLLKQYIIKNHLKLDDYLFRRVGYRAIQFAVRKYALKAGIEHNVSFHNFRHYFVTELVRQGWHYEDIAKLTGHSNPGTLVNYDHAVASDVREDALEALKSL